MSNHDFRLLADSGHAWLEVPRVEVVASGAEISRYSYYDPVTDMAYLEEDCDATVFLEAAGLYASAIGEEVNSSMPRQLPAYDAADFIDSHVHMVRPARKVSGNDGLEAAR